MLRLLFIPARDVVGEVSLRAFSFKWHFSVLLAGGDKGGSSKLGVPQGQPPPSLFFSTFSDKIRSFPPQLPGAWKPPWMEWYS